MNNCSYKYNESLKILETYMNENNQEIINIVKTTIKDVMIEHLFEPIDMVTIASIEKTIINELINKIDVDFSVEANFCEDADIKVQFLILWNDLIHEDTLITASYVVSGVSISNIEKKLNDTVISQPSEMDIKVNAFDKAMEII